MDALGCLTPALVTARIVSLHLAGCTPAKLEQVAREIREHGRTATIAQLDALDEGAADAHAGELVRDHEPSTSR